MDLKRSGLFKSLKNKDLNLFWILTKTKALNSDVFGKKMIISVYHQRRKRVYNVKL